MRLKETFRGLFSKKGAEPESFYESPKPKAPLIRGLFCDVQGTIVTNAGVDRLLVQYLNTKYLSGEQVTIFSTGGKKVISLLKLTPLHEDLINAVKSKDEYHGKHIETWIDDAPTKLITAELHVDPANQNFRHMMQEYLDAKSGPQPPELSL